MKIVILLKSGPCTDESKRAMQTAGDMLAQGHTVSLYLLQEAVRLCASGTRYPDSMGLPELIENNLDVHVLACDAELRGITAPFADQAILEGSYDSLVELMESCDRVVGLL